MSIKLEVGKLTPFGKLTPEEQGALLLAEHNGESIQVYTGPSQSWVTMGFAPTWYDGQPYRIKPKVKMQEEHWVVFSHDGFPYTVVTDPMFGLSTGEYMVHHPAVEMKETT